MELHDITESMVDHLCDILRDVDQEEDLRCSAAFLLGGRKGPQAFETLSCVLGRRDESRNVKREAIRALRGIGGDKAFEVLEELALRGGEVTILREDAVDALLSMDEARAWLAIGGLAGDDDKDLAETVIHLLVHAEKPEAVEVLEILMGLPLSDDPCVPEEALRKMHELDAERAVPTLLRVVKSANEDGVLFETAIQLLGESHPDQLVTTLKERWAREAGRGQ